MKWHEFSSSEEAVRAMVRDISAVLRQEIATTGRAGLAVSGGRSPLPLFEALSVAPLPWKDVRITLVDERHVAPDHPDSNESLVRTHLLKNQASAARFTGLAGPALDMRDDVARANRQADEITLALLGMGEDGHTASWFPGAPQLGRALDPALADRYIHVTPPSAPHERISMTLAALLTARRIMLAVAGPTKRAVFEQASRHATPDMPVSYVIAQTGVPFDVYWHA
ncbi:6-phosphogluconolactonase [Pollutimonas sp. M17]|uniref:6-phosphogluconolactonase n=1 Tax=Pollutimonas sp. M17 TaxID=2962065 RepID=UPI0021F4022C|nr:6-phosphogluconolactonase [Pollutimonas sp. M17]UYO94724.1 6-phosphogluconolactonase [Pollutimonas sp. M17]